MTTPAPHVGAGRVASAAALIAVLTVASRIAGFGRTTVFTWVVGDRSDLGDMYLVANTIPNIIFEIVAGGALASLVVPLLAGAVAAGDRRAVTVTTSALLTWTVTLLVPIAVLLAVLAEPVITALAADRTAAEQALAARMLRIFAPQLPLYGVGIVLAGVLQAHRRFAWPVLAPLLSSLTVIATYLTFAEVQGRQVSAAQVGRLGEWILAGGTTAGVLVLSLCLLIPLRGLRLRVRPGYRLAPGARERIGGLATAGAVTVATQQIALLALLRTAATDAPDGSVVVYTLAQTVYLLPWSVLAVPVAVAAYPTLAAAAASGDTRGYHDTLAPAVRAVLLLSCLGAATLVATAVPVARLLPGVSAPATLAMSIIGFAPGLLGYGLFAVLTRALYARGDTGAATVAVAVGWLTVPVAAVALATILPEADRALAVALANTTGMLLLGALLVVVTRRRAGAPALAGFARAGTVGPLAAIVAALAGGVVTGLPDLAGGVVAGLPGTADGTPGVGTVLLQGMLSGVVTVGVFLAVVYPLNRRDVQPVVRRIQRRATGLSSRLRRR